jgi:hypothetical protein
MGDPLHGREPWRAGNALVSRGGAAERRHIHQGCVPLIARAGRVALRDDPHQPSGCYIPLRLLADSTQLVTESHEYDNGRWTVGLAYASCSTQPRYKVNAVKFTAVEESGIDLTGSDEPYFVFRTLGADGAQRRSQSRVFGDIDTGDTVWFDGTEGCLYRLLVVCSDYPAPNGIGFSIMALEQDFGAEDLIGSQTYAYDPVFLAARLAVAKSFEDVRTFTDGDAVYVVTVVVARV